MSCERERKRSYRKQMRARRKEAKAAAAPDLPEPVVAAIEPEAARDSVVILAMHRGNVAALTAELAEVNRLRERAAVLQNELASQSTLIDGLAEELLNGRGSDEELGKANIRQASLEAQLDRLHKHQHSAELSLQRRLTADIRAMARLEAGYIAFELDRETERFSLLLVESRRDLLRETCRQCAEASLSYSAKLSALGDYVQESYAWNRPLDDPVSQKTEHSTKVIRDPLFALPQREAIVGSLLDMAGRAIRRWEALLKSVATCKGFALPSYEEPIPLPEVPEPYPDETKEVHAFWTQADLQKPDYEVPVFTPHQPGAAA